MRGVGVVCEMCMFLSQGRVGDVVGEWMRGLGLGFNNPVRTGGVGTCVWVVVVWVVLGGVGDWPGSWSERVGVVLCLCVL